MVDGFKSAATLVAWAQKKFFKELPTHQWETFQRNTATTEFKIVIKEILEHLRSALDYCAWDICQPLSGQILPSQKIYFPIAPTGSNLSRFRSQVGRNMPGVLGTKEDLVAILASFQEFSSPQKNDWLPALATLAGHREQAQESERSVARYNRLRSARQRKRNEGVLPSKA